MTTAKTVNNVDQSLANESQLFTENDSVVVKDVVLARASDGPDQSRSSSSMVSFSENQVLLPSAVMWKTKTCTREWLDNHSLLIQYEFSSRSSYSGQSIIISSFSRQHCYEVASSNDFTLLDTPLVEFQPPESNFTISSISKGEKQYFREVVREIEVDNQDMNNDQACQLASTYEFPMADVCTSGVTRALIGGGGGGVYIHIFVFCPTDFF